MTYKLKGERKDDLSDHSCLQNKGKMTYSLKVKVKREGKALDCS